MLLLYSHTFDGKYNNLTAYCNEIYIFYLPMLKKKYLQLFIQSGIANDTIRAMYFPMISNSRFTTLPSVMAWKLVFSWV